MESAYNLENIRLISDICISVLRDRSISSSYGYYLSICNEAPDLTLFFSPLLSKKLMNDFENYGIKIDGLCLYSGLGDLYSQLTRLLILCRESTELKPYVEAANIRIGKIAGVHMSKDDAYIRHLRNAVMHERIEFEPRKGLVIFVDKRHDGTNTAEFIFNSQQLNELIEILLSDVLLKYLSDIGWSLS